MKTKLKDILVDIISGEWGDEDIEGKGLPIIRTTNFTKDGRINYSNIEYRLITKKVRQKNGEVVKEIDDEKIEKKKLLDGDIIIEKSGGGIGSPVGRVVYFTSPDNKTYLCNNFTQILRVNKSKVLPKYVFYYLKYLYNKGTVLKYQNQTTGLFNLKLEKYLQEEIFIPQKDIQNLIITQLDVIQYLLEKRSSSIELLRNIKDSIFNNLFGDPIINQKSFPKKRIEQIVTKEKNSLRRGPFGGALKKEIFVEDGYLVYEQYHALNNDFNFERYYIDKETYQNLEAFKVKEGDIIISCSGENLGRLAIIPNGYKEGIINQALLKISLDNNILKNTFFRKLFLNENFKKKYFGVKRGAGVPNFPPITKFKNFEVICPPVYLQEQYIEIEKQIDNLSECYDNQFKYLKVISNALLQDVFKDKAEIDEEPIFRELMKKFTIAELKGNKQRLRYLLNLFAENKFDNTDDYGYAKGILFELINIKEIEQKIIDDKIGLVVNETN